MDFKDTPLDVMLLAGLCWISGVFYIIIAISFTLTVHILSFIPIEIGVFYFATGIVANFFLIAMAIFSFFVGLGLLFEKEWAWLLALVVFAFGIFNFWIGTIINLIAIVYMFTPKIRNFFNIEIG